jgi:hypothetical protein
VARAAQVAQQVLLGAMESLLRCAAASGRPDPAQVRPGCRRLLHSTACIALLCAAPHRP